MRTLSKAILVTGMIAVSGAHAGTTALNPYYADSETGKAYVGVKAGTYIASNVKKGVKDPMAYGLYAGYHFDRNFSAEVEYVASDDKKGKYEAETMGAYGVYRHYLNDSNLYAKGKLGVANTKVEDIDSKELAGGVGVGIQAAKNLDVEAEYSRVLRENNKVTDVDLDTVTIGARLKF